MHGGTVVTVEMDPVGVESRLGADRSAAPIARVVCCACGGGLGAAACTGSTGCCGRGGLAALTVW
jgi:hypothetical protein